MAVSEIDQRVNELWSMPTEQWPVSLQQAVRDAFDRQGKCGEVAAEAIRAWVLGGEK